MFGLDLTPLVVSVVVPLAMAVFGTMLAGDGLRAWYPTIRHPRLEPPLWGFVLIGLVVYVIDGVIVYRLLAVVDEPIGQAIGLTGVLVVMLYNELWNAVLFRLRSPYWAMVGLFGFLAPLLVLVVTLFLVDALSGWLMLAYLAWVIGFDVPWIVRLWQLNRD